MVRLPLCLRHTPGRLGACLGHLVLVPCRMHTCSLPVASQGWPLVQFAGEGTGPFRSGARTGIQAGVPVMATAAPVFFLSSGGGPRALQTEGGGVSPQACVASQFGKPPGFTYSLLPGSPQPGTHIKRRVGHLWTGCAVSRAHQVSYIFQITLIFSLFFWIILLH